MERARDGKGTEGERKEGEGKRGMGIDFRGMLRPAGNWISMC